MNAQKRDTAKLGYFTFTLIELLIVICIIAILTAMLLPALSNARKRGQSLTCLSNLRQCGLWTFNYSNDFAGWTQEGRPVQYTYPNNYWSYLMLQWEYIPKHPTLPQPTASAAKILQCPSVAPYGKWINQINTYSFRGFDGTPAVSTHFTPGNGNVRISGNESTGLASQSIAQSLSQFPLVFDSYAWTGASYQIAFANSDSIGLNHLCKAGTLFFDGHAALADRWYGYFNYGWFLGVKLPISH
jgi:type II secretory pathway pseudopilin PulG